MQKLRNKDDILDPPHLVVPGAEETDLLSGHYEFHSRESPQEMQSRLHQEALDARLRRAKDLTLFVLTLLGVFGLGFVCVGIVLNPGSPPTTVTWAVGILTALVSGAIGYLTGKATAAK